MTTANQLHLRVGTRDRLSQQAEQARGELHDEVMTALDDGDLAAARAAIERHELQLQALSENLRSYQAELRAQTDELSLSNARTDAALARLSSLFTAMPVAVLLATSEGELLERSARADALFELPPGGPVRFVQQLVDPGEHQALVRQALAAGRGTCLERVCFVALSGRRFVGELHLAPLPAAEGQPACMTCVVVDRSESLAQLQAVSTALDQIGTQRALMAESARLARIGGFEVDSGDGAWRASPELCRLLDWTGRPPSLEEFLALGTPTQAQVMRNALQHARADGTPFDLELELTVPDGRVLHTLVLGRCVAAPGGRESVVGLVQDVSPQLQALAGREAAEAANRAKGQFLMRMSHELRTPLNAVIGFTQLMRMEAARGDLTVKPKRLEMMDTAARHLLEVINEVLDVSRIENDKLALTIEPLPVAPLLHECLTLVQGLADTAGVTLQPLVGGESVQVLADRLRLKEVLINLLSNAVKYNRPQGQVHVHLNGDERHVRIAVTDTGRGLDESALAGLFQPFNRLGAEATAIEGSGIGLYVSKRFVEAMHGCLDVSSRAGAGSTFTVTLPRV